VREYIKLKKRKKKKKKVILHSLAIQKPIEKQSQERKDPQKRFPKFRLF